MNSEAEIQSWFDQRAKKQDIHQFIVNRKILEDAVKPHYLASGDKKCEIEFGSSRTALLNSQRVLSSLYESELLTSNENVATAPGISLKPDLLLRDYTSGAFVVIELKKSRQTERQAVTELLAYAELISQQNNGVDVLLIIVSTIWKDLLDFAVINLIHNSKHSVLPLELDLTKPAEPRLTIRMKLLLQTKPANLVPVTALQSVTLSCFFFNYHADTPYRRGTITAHLKRENWYLARRGEKAGYSGFSILWVTTDGGFTGWHLTALTTDPSLCNTKEYKNEFLDEVVVPALDDFMQAKNLEPPTLDSSFRLLQEIDYQIYPELLSEIGSHPSWAEIQEELKTRNAQLLSFFPFGLFCDHLRQYSRDVFFGDHEWLHPDFDFRLLDTANPLFWIPALDDFTGEGITTKTLQTLLGAFQLGKIISAACHNNRTDITNTFNYLSGLSRFLSACRVVHDYCKEMGENKPFWPYLKVIKGLSNRLILSEREIYRIIDWAECFYKKIGKWHLVAFNFGLSFLTLDGQISPDQMLSERKIEFLKDFNDMLFHVRSCKNIYSSQDYISHKINLENQLQNEFEISLGELTNKTTIKYLFLAVDSSLRSEDKNSKVINVRL